MMFESRDGLVAPLRGQISDLLVGSDGEGSVQAERHLVAIHWRV